MRVGSMLQVFFGALDGHEFGNSYCVAAGLVHAIMLPDVSTKSRKYGFEGSGHAPGFGLRHSGGSCADAPRASVSTARAADVRRTFRALTVQPPAVFWQQPVTQYVPAAHCGCPGRPHG